MECGGLWSGLDGSGLWSIKKYSEHSGGCRELAVNIRGLGRTIGHSGVVRALVLLSILNYAQSSKTLKLGWLCPTGRYTLVYSWGEFMVFLSNSTSMQPAVDSTLKTCKVNPRVIDLEAYLVSTVLDIASTKLDLVFILELLISHLV